ncbi:TPA: PD-(D/E)XK nuclease family transposase [Candidatus Ventrenecus avicola]|nr:PD-(D/E)XK nuclease family transposase [Candidatus Ventrenecus avicola]
MNNQENSIEDFVFDPMNDAAFKSLIRAEETRDIVIGVLSDITPVLESELKNALFLGGEVPKELLKEKGMVSDVIVRVNDKNGIIIEANRQYSKNLFDKNASYAFKNSYMESNVGKREYHPVSLVSVDKENVFDTDKPILVFQIQDEEGHIETELYYSVHLILENFQNLAYTISDRVRKFMEFFQNQPDTIANLKEKYKDGEMMAFVNKAEELSKSTEFINYYNLEEMHEAEKQDFYHTGVEDEKLAIAKKMLGKYSLEEIQELTGLSEEEISKLKETSDSITEEE